MNTDQAVTLEAAEDHDGGYHSVTAELTATEGDNDTKAITLNPTSGTVTQGSTADYKVKWGRSGFSRSSPGSRHCTGKPTRPHFRPDGGLVRHPDNLPVDREGAQTDGRPALPPRQRGCCPMSPDGPEREHRFRTAEGLDRRRGVLLASSYECLGRYTRWEIGFADPPLEIVARGRSGTVRALNERPDPEAEEEETRLKAAALLDAIARPDPPAEAGAETGAKRPGAGRTILMVDHQDSFVHTLAAYLRETGAEVVTLRAGFAPERIDEIAPDLVVLSPGPGTPADFGVADTIGAALARGLPVFGVCLGLQGIVEHFGGRLGTLGYPMHGKPSTIRWRGGRLLAGLPERFEAGRYHSLFGERDTLPDCLEVTADTEDGVVMAIEHRTLPVAAVQFHPESILTLGGEVGRRLIHEVVARLHPAATQAHARRAAS